MSQDIISDSLNQLMNARKIEKKEVILKRYSKLLINLFAIMKQKGIIDYEFNEDEKILRVQILRLHECRAVKPRFYAKKNEVEKYLRRFLPSRNLGFLVISTNKGLMTHQEVIANKIGGSLVAYFY